jgi:hypothetical protein
MSDAYYQERAKRRARLLWIAAAIVALIVLAVVVIWSLYRDACTKSFERSPTAIVSAFLEAVSSGDVATAQECWEHDTYYDLEAGCSDICLSKVYGAQFEVTGITLGEPHTTAGGRANLPATVSIACTSDGQTHTAEIVLDSVGSDLPWKHWAIIHSTFGGSVVEPWCKD